MVVGMYNILSMCCPGNNGTVVLLASGRKIQIYTRPPIKRKTFLDGREETSYLYLS